MIGWLFGAVCVLVLLAFAFVWVVVAPPSIICESDDDEYLD